MFYVIMILLVLVMGPFLFKLYKRRLVKRRATEISFVYSRIKLQFNYRDFSNVILFIWIMYFGIIRNYSFGIEYSAAYTPLLLGLMINQIKRFDNIELTEDYIFFEMMHLNWNEVDRIYVENNKTLVINSDKLLFGTLRIESIDNLIEIENEASQIMNS